MAKPYETTCSSACEVLVLMSFLDSARRRFTADFSAIKIFLFKERPCANREDRIRTCDTLVPNQVLYQAELLPGKRSVITTSTFSIQLTVVLST